MSACTNVHTLAALMKVHFRRGAHSTLFVAKCTSRWRFQIAFYRSFFAVRPLCKQSVLVVHYLLGRARDVFLPIRSCALPQDKSSCPIADTKAFLSLPLVYV